MARNDCLLAVPQRLVRSVSAPLPCAVSGMHCCCAHLQERGDVATCLVTGNLEPIGWGKMKALGIDHLFSIPL